MNWQDILNSNLVSSIIALIGVIISVVCSTGKVQKGIDQALKVYESELSKKVYASSKRIDLEYELVRGLGKCCGRILQLMQQMYPDRISTLIIKYKESPSLNTLAIEIRDFEREINYSRSFLSREIIAHYETLLENAEEFLVDAIRHQDCWEETKDDRARKEELKGVAYLARKSFEDNWRKTGNQVKILLLSRE